MKNCRTRARKSVATTHGLHRRLEALEDRTVPSVSINIGDGTVKEVGNLTTFVPGNQTILEHPRGMAFGPDRTGDSAQDLYVVGGFHNNLNSNKIVVYDGLSGAFVEEYVPPGSALNNSGWLTFDSNGNLYTSTAPASNPARNVILRVDHATQAVSTFVPSAANGGLTNARALAFGPDGNLYVGCDSTHQVLRYDGTTGAFIDAFVTAGSGGLTNPSGVLFGPDRNGDSMLDLYVGSYATDQVIVFNGVTGSPLGSFVVAGSGSLDGPWDMQFGPDGNLYVVSAATSYEQVFRFDGATGAFIDIPVAAGNGLAPETAFIAFDRHGELFVSGQYANEVLRNSSGPLVTLSEVSASPVAVDFSTAGGTASQGGDFGALSGRFTFAPGETSKRILVSAVDDGMNEPSETFSINLSNASGANLGDGQGVVTILNSQTRFFVVDDGATAPNGPNIADKTYEYESGGASIISNVLTFNNSAPRGAASNTAGSRLWVIDANRTVYVYDNRNVLLGSWSAGSLPTNAALEGIATNGTDIWLLDNGGDKVYKYIGAASRLSGSQNAASSFNLVNGKNGNANGKGIVTDGTSFWVVDDASTDKVFKYTLTGSSLGSWTISAANASPTGLTINPASVSDIWIVDNGTDKVYQYAAAAGRTSGSQNSAATFTLAAGNTNPQDIADPPAISVADATGTEGSVNLKFLDRFIPDGNGGLTNLVRCSIFGPDGNLDGVQDLYVVDAGSNAIRRYDGLTGWSIDTFVPSGSGGLNGPTDLTFGPDGDLYVSSQNGNQILRYDGLSGAFHSVVASGLAIPVGIMFGADGSLYIANQDTNEVLRYHNSVLNTFVTAGSGGLNRPRNAFFGPDGNGDGLQDLYVASSGNDKVLRYNGLSGAFIDTFASTNFVAGPIWSAIGTDGYLYTTGRDSIGNVIIDRLDGSTGIHDSIALGRDGWSFIVGPENILYDSSNASGAFVERFGRSSLAAFIVSLDSVSPTPVTVNYATANGTALAGDDFLTTSGTLTFAPGQTTRTILVRTLDDTLAEPTETFVVNLSNPVGATIGDSQAIGTIIDNDPPAVHVASFTINDGVAQRSRVTKLAVTFTGQVAFAGPVSNAFTLMRIGGGQVGSFSATASVVNGVTVVTLTDFAGAETEFGSLADDRYTLTVLANQITTPGGLDGNGDGTAGDDYVLIGSPANGLFRLFGDANGDGTVNGTDFLAFRLAFTGTGTTFDFDGSGQVTGTDFLQFRLRFLQSV